MKFSVTIKLGPQVLAHVEGREISDDALTVRALREVIDLEQKLEKLTGLRFHISHLVP